MQVAVADLQVAPVRPGDPAVGGNGQRQRRPRGAPEGGAVGGRGRGRGGLTRRPRYRRRASCAGSPHRRRWRR